ncbi:serine/threonine-protein kinase CTR1-like [Telopea speciosissima]|uniref:serine/threonine-protein kinase CTR1-like n=1 Tax=Telopea speciosissima TaxID=54955 RepID=UPI001CC3D826|nr:serine/threonine-protein kinase CTR1-like [Telopea speciosissima]
MEMPGSGRRSNYMLLSQYPEEQQLQPQQQPSKFTVAATGPFYESHSGEKNKGKTDRGFDWDGDHRLQQGGGRIGNLFPSMGLQRQSSGSSFGESSLSGDYYLPTLSMTANDPEMFSHSQDDGFKVGGGELRVKSIDAAGSSSCKSWAQQTEESYQLQLALALRLSSEATCADDPNFLDPVPDESASRSSSSASAESLSHRFWVTGCLSYFDKIPEGFYLIHGMDPYVWTVCTDLQENGRVPSIESLRAVDPKEDFSIDVVLIDKHSDPGLKELLNRVLSISSSCITTNEVVDQLATLVCNRMGGAASSGEDDLASRWKDCSAILKDCLSSIVLPMGSLSVGLCRQRVLLFKVLADTIDLPCRIAKGCKYCQRDDASSCLVRFGLDREYLVDLIEKPGCLGEPDSLLNGPSTISISSPLRLPKFKPVGTTQDFRLLARQYFSDCQSLNLVFDDASAGSAINQEDAAESLFHKHFDRPNMDRNVSPVTNDNDESFLSPLPQRADWQDVHDRESQVQNLCNPVENVMIPKQFVKDSVQLKPIAPNRHRDVQWADTSKDLRFPEGSVPSKSSTELSLEVEDLDIPWSELVLKERIGAGSFGTVHRADWHGSDVAVKILMEQDLHAERFKEFLREVAIMKRLRHPNIVLFMGAVTQPPNLSIVTEYLSRGSLYRLLHRPGAREVLDERRRLNMAYDVAKGMNYLHRRNPPIVHRDLKSPNLLVDRKYTVKVCDFGLSRLKANTFLSSKSAAGTPEWMAPEVLRDEPSNEKSDVYSFGIILWELVTLQQPWSNLNPAQVVAAVGFKGKRLEIPSNVNPQVTALIEACWADEPWKRPSFYGIMESLRPLVKPPMPPPVRADVSPLT